MASKRSPGASSVDLLFDAQCRIHGRDTLQVGHPFAEPFEAGFAAVFDGAGDGLELSENPLQGLSSYRVEVTFRPDAGGPDEQRFFHAGTVDGDRLLLETRPAQPAGWCLDAYLKSGGASCTLIDRRKAHALGRWYNVAAVVGDGRFTAFVDGVEELTADLPATPLPPGRLSLGCRLNRVSWFRGAIARVRIA